MERAQADINNMERLPEGCISDILSLTTPADVCRSSLFSTLFKSAADSDVLWEKFLPDDYQDIISKALLPFPSAAAPSKKELYYRLSDVPLLIDGGSKSFHLQKSSGKKCIMLGAKELGIAWGDDRRHWSWRGYPGSRFANVAELEWVCWLDIHGKLETRLLSPKTFYAAYLVLKFKESLYRFNKKPVKARVEVVGRAGDNNSVPNGGGGQHIALERGDGWMEVEIGYFYNEELEDDEGGEVHMYVLETERQWTKRGIIVQDLQWVCRLEIRGKLETRLLSPKTLYASYLVLKFNERVVYGFEFQPIKAKVEVVGNSRVCSEERCIYLSPNGGQGQHFARERGDGWVEVEIGHFYNDVLSGRVSPPMACSVSLCVRLPSQILNKNKLLKISRSGTHR
ncbi:hypothetical protein MKW98_002935 [Papaver atlanticum]|uniref:F-box domain-containing protein n=1 Tax=Papaver atlanticum TaxID=357466 RepID=A0AAD4T0Z0_9MAGN|nr:hypothetical protein MKW98_002935 [Papaver atlanticum]